MSVSYQCCLCVTSAGVCITSAGVHITSAGECVAAALLTSCKRQCLLQHTVAHKTGKEGARSQEHTSTQLTRHISSALTHKMRRHTAHELTRCADTHACHGVRFRTPHMWRYLPPRLRFRVLPSRLAAAMLPAASPLAAAARKASNSVRFPCARMSCSGRRDACD